MDSSAGALQVAKIWKLPAELLTKICELCSLDDVVNLSQTSSVLRYQCERLLRSERFWETVVPWRGRYFFDSDQEELFTFDRATFLEQEPVSDRTFSFLKARDGQYQTSDLAAPAKEAHVLRFALFTDPARFQTSLEPWRWTCATALPRAARTWLDRLRCCVGISCRSIRALSRSADTGPATKPESAAAPARKKI